MFTAEHARLNRDLVGQQYMPSNGTEGEIFQSEWCARCQRDRAMREGIPFEDIDPERESCQILNASYRGEAFEWVYDASGQPLCTAFVPAGDRVVDRCQHTTEMFPTAEAAQGESL